MAEPRCAIRFLRRGCPVEVADLPPDTMLLDYLRLTERAVGTKEGCNEGDCGACTVALRRLRDGAVVVEPVNACILLLGQVDGAEVITVEDLAAEGELHPVQRAMVEHHGSQCGFCTPGIVMSLFARHHTEGEAPSREAVVDQLAGNLCRCTGYRPIVDAAMAAAGDDGAWHARYPTGPAAADGFPLATDDGDLFVGDASSFFAAPASLESLCALYAEHPDATLVGGATDVGLWITKQLRSIPKIIATSRARELEELAIVANGPAVSLVVGAAVTYERAHAALAAHIDPDLGELVRRIGSKQVRASGTIGGNIANGSPIGDMPPALIALGATLHLRRGDEERALPLEDFFIAYGRQDRQPGEVVTAVEVPSLEPDAYFRAYKIAKRFDQDISAVMGAFKIRLEAGRVAAARIAFGGMAGTPKRALAAEAALTGADLDDPATWSAAVVALGEDFSPLSDHRASAAYRLLVARNLLKKALAEIAMGSTAETRLIGRREARDERVA